MSEKVTAREKNHGSENEKQSISLEITISEYDSEKGFLPGADIRLCGVMKVDAETSMEDLEKMFGLDETPDMHMGM